MERAGFILGSGEIIEFSNKAGNPAAEFTGDPREILVHIDKDVVALWHTHPAGDPNLSAEDWKSFLEWPGTEHVIVAKDGVRYYGVKGRGVINLPGPIT